MCLCKVPIKFNFASNEPSMNKNWSTLEKNRFCRFSKRPKNFLGVHFEFIYLKYAESDFRYFLFELTTAPDNELQIVFRERLQFFGHLGNVNVQSRGNKK